MKAGRSKTEKRYRSLLQKAVRRGNADLVFTTSAFLESLASADKNWYLNQTAIITFEECWPLGAELIFNKKFHSKVAALIRVTRATKARDATGLGYLAYALSQGDTSVLDDTAGDKAIKIVANAIRRPDDFWQWITWQKTAAAEKNLIDAAIRFKNAGRPHDNAVVQAAAYLSVTGQLARIEAGRPSDPKFPYWVVFDNHTPEGQRALRDIARDLHISLSQLEWTYFYFEGASANGEIPSKWWDRHCRWHFRKIELPANEAHLLWDPARVQLEEALTAEGRQLKNELYRWKLTHREGIESLKRQVQLYLDHMDEIQRDQGGLF
ncbi:MAG: hypothetical protein JRF29_14305 [Deltaproteobacteria bacterium]|nr:hypothetical protein [Deltaproteobacteria bacterium]